LLALWSAVFLRVIGQSLIR